MPDQERTGPDGGLLRGFLAVKDGGEGPHAYVLADPEDAEHNWFKGEHIGGWLSQFPDGAEVTVMVKTKGDAA